VFDDAVAIVRNKDVTNKSISLSDLFKSDFWGFQIDSSIHKSYRPLTILMFRIESQTFGLQPVVMKSINLGLHTLISVLLIPFLRYVLEFKDNSLVFYSAILFAVHPVHVEAVSGIVSRAELMVCLLYLMGVIGYSTAANGDKQVSVVKQAILLTIVALLQSLAILFKETGIVILVNYTTLMR
jgi:protein O-mannosyl-transferase